MLGKLSLADSLSLADALSLTDSLLLDPLLLVLLLDFPLDDEAELPDEEGLAELLSLRLDDALLLKSLALELLDPLLEPLDDCEREPLELPELLPPLDESDIEE